MRKPRFLQKNRTIEDIIRYMEEKYEDTFTYRNSDTESYLSGETEIWLRAVKLPGQLVLVLRDKNTGDLVDNYLGLLLREEIEEEVRRAAVQVYGDCLVVCETGMVRVFLDMRSTDGRAFLSNPGTKSRAEIITRNSPERKEEDLEGFAEVLRAERFNLGFSVTYIDPAVFPEVTAKNYNDYADPAKPCMLCRGFFKFRYPELSHIDWTDEHLRFANSVWRRGQK
ncbi:MAG: hypothetical protein LBK56_00775 [Gracilibacteraceae bacterium]|nr:hypothetical protein [Gracilibacteraceae bacterium]